jgi:hypothetical protein
VPGVPCGPPDKPRGDAPERRRSLQDRRGGFDTHVFHSAHRVRSPGGTTPKDTGCGSRPPRTGVTSGPRKPHPALPLCRRSGSPGSNPHFDPAQRSANPRLARWRLTPSHPPRSTRSTSLGDKLELFTTALASRCLGAVAVPASTMLTAGELGNQAHSSHGGQPESGNAGARSVLPEVSLEPVVGVGLVVERVDFGEPRGLVEAPGFDERLVRLQPQRVQAA